jgi:hypothetical protein
LLEIDVIDEIGEIRLTIFIELEGQYYHSCQIDTATVIALTNSN